MWLKATFSVCKCKYIWESICLKCKQQPTFLWESIYIYIYSSVQWVYCKHTVGCIYMHYVCCLKCFLGVQYFSGFNSWGICIAKSLWFFRKILWKCSEVTAVQGSPTELCCASMRQSEKKFNFSDCVACVEAHTSLHSHWFAWLSKDHDLFIITIIILTANTTYITVDAASYFMGKEFPGLPSDVFMLLCLHAASWLCQDWIWRLKPWGTL